MEENFYNLEDDEENISELNVDGALDLDIDLEGESEDEEELAWSGETNKDTKSKPAFLMLLRCVFSPVEGFKSLKRSGIGSDKFASDCFYPLIALAAISNFTSLIYNDESTVVVCLTQGIITFITFFFGYFTTILCSRWLLDSETCARLTTNYFKIFLMVCNCSLILCYIIYNIFPMLGPVMALMPIWTIYLVNIGTRFIGKNNNSNIRTKVILSFLIIFSLLMWNWIFGEILPNVES